MSGGASNPIGKGGSEGVSISLSCPAKVLGRGNRPWQTGNGYAWQGKYARQDSLGATRGTAGLELLMDAWSNSHSVASASTIRPLVLISPTSFPAAAWASCSVPDLRMAPKSFLFAWPRLAIPPTESPLFRPKSLGRAGRASTSETMPKLTNLTGIAAQLTPPGTAREHAPR